jgi:hypothetical protein
MSEIKRDWIFLSQDANWIRKLFIETGLSEEYFLNFRQQIQSLISDFHRQRERDDLTRNPTIRDYRPLEGIVQWLNDPNGGAPWLQNGMMTMNFLQHHAPKAYKAVRNYLRNNPSSPDIPDVLKSPKRYPKFRQPRAKR